MSASLASLVNARMEKANLLCQKRKLQNEHLELRSHIRETLQHQHQIKLDNNFRKSELERTKDYSKIGVDTDLKINVSDIGENETIEAYKEAGFELDDSGTILTRIKTEEELQYDAECLFEEFSDAWGEDAININSLEMMDSYVQSELDAIENDITAQDGIIQEAKKRGEEEIKEMYGGGR